MKDGPQLRPFQRIGNFQRVEAEIRVAGEASDEDPFPVLRHKRLCVDHAKIDVVAQLFRQHVVDDLEGAPTIMVHQVLHVLEEKNLRAMMSDNARHIEKQRSLSFAGESVRPVERVFLGDAGDGKRLAGKARKQNVVRRYVCLVDLRDVAGNRVRVTREVRKIGLLRITIPLGRVNAPAADGVEAPAQPADAGEKVDEGESRRGAVIVMAGRPG